MGKWHYRYGGEVTEKVREIKPDTGEITVTLICDRCGGLGGGDQWKHTGWTCYKCGGARTVGTKVVKVYTEEKIAKLDKAAEKRRATAEKKRAAKEEAAAAERAANLKENQAENVRRFPEAVKILGRDDLDGNFFDEMVKAHAEGFKLTVNQARAIRHGFGKLVLKRHRNRHIDAWEKLDGQVPAGRHEVEAALLSVKMYEDRYSYSPNAVTYKALWLTSKGYKIFGSLPSGIRFEDCGDWVNFKRGIVYRFRATLQPSGDDPGFGFYKRPYMLD